MFFNPLTKASTNPNYKVLATAQLTVTDQTDASNLAGNMTIVNGSKSQTFLTGNAQPYNPDWKRNNLVIRPYMIATNITRGSQSSKYNPDLFDPFEYPNLESPGDLNVSGKYIYDLEWYIVDSANNQTKIDVKHENFRNKFSHEWTYTGKGGTSVRLTDKRTLVIKDNILEKDGIASLIVKFSFHDPFADIRIPVAYEIQINNISTGMGSSKASINAIDGNTFYNAAEEDSLRLEALYFTEGTEVNLDSILSSASTSGWLVEWFIKTPNGWTLLDPVTQDDNEWNSPSEKLYEIHRVTQRDELGNVISTAKTTNAKGGTILIIKPGLIAGSDIIKLVVTDGNTSGIKSSALETIYDHSDPTQCYIFSTNGDKLYKGMNAPGTTMKAVVTYRGELFDDDDPRYNTMFDYYWYRIDGQGNVVENMYLEDGVIKFIDTSNPSYTAENGYPKKLARSVDIKPNHIDYKATFTVDLLNHQAARISTYRTNLLRSMPLEDELNDAKIILERAGLDTLNNEEVIKTAMEIRAFTISQEDNIIESYNILRNRGE